MKTRAKRLARRALRAALVRHARARPRSLEGADRRVTILLVSVWGMGGTIRAALNLAGYLAQNGYEVEILSVFRRRDDPFFGGFPPGVKVTPIDDQRPSAVPTGLKGRLRAHLSKRKSVFMPRDDFYFKDSNGWIDLQLVRHLHRRTGFLIGARPGINCVIEQLCPPGMVSIGLEQMNLGLHGEALKRTMARHYPGLDRVVTLTETDREAFRERFGDLRLAAIPNTARALEGKPPDLARPVVLAAGRFVPQKGFDYLVEAYAEIAAKHPEWTLRLCGNGKWRKKLERMIEERGIGDAVRMEGPVDMAEATSNASIFVLPSRFEGFPLILLEAMSKGMAVVAFDCPTGPADIIDDHRNGLLVPPRDAHALAGALDEMMGDEELRRRCAAEAVKTAEAYTIEAVGPRWETLLGEVWAERQDAGSPAGT